MCASLSIIIYRLLASVMPSSESTYFVRHPVDIGLGSVVHHRIGIHEIDLPLVIIGVAYSSVFDSCLHGFQVHRSFDDFMVVRCFRVFDWVVENVAVSMLGDLRV